MKIKIHGLKYIFSVALTFSLPPSRTAHVVDLEAHQRNGVTLMLMIIRLLIIIFIIIGVVVGGGAGALVNFKTSSKFPIVLE